MTSDYPCDYCAKNRPGECDTEEQKDACINQNHFDFEGIDIEKLSGNYINEIR
jgi:hypothetical protein